jgi:predicted dithiol-disulfide oxidoreductase (DUF899 family)
MNEDEVVGYLREFFEKEGWKVKYVPARGGHFERDLVAEKEDNKYIIQAKGDMPYKETFQIQYAVGQTVAEMREVGPEICYAIALPEAVAKKLWKFGLVGLQTLNLHLFVITDYGGVHHLNPEKVFEFTESLRKYGEDNVYASTFSVSL